MIKVAFLGSDSTHTEAFGKRMRDPALGFHGRAKVVSIWGQDSQQTKSKADALGIEHVAARPQEAIERADLVMCIGRFGDSHFVPAKLALEMGKKTFVDKPFTCSLPEAEQLAELSAKTGAALCSSSPLRFCKEVVDLKLKMQAQTLESLHVMGPAHCIDLQGDSRFESNYFYGIHSAEILLEIVNSPMRDFKIVARGAHNVVILKFENGMEAALDLVRNVEEFYSFTACFKQEMYSPLIQLDGSYYTNMLEHILVDFYQKQKSIPLHSSVAAIRILAELEKGPNA